MDEDRISLEIDGHILRVKLNRPDKLNALDLKMFQALHEVGRKLLDDTNARVVILSGEGKAFCAGLDLNDAMNIIPQAFQKDEDEICNFVQKVSYQWQQIPVPVICVLHGVVYGGGLQIALGADLRVAHPDSRLSVREIKLGLIPDMGVTQTIRNLVGIDFAKELTWTGRELCAEEAQQRGLVTRIADDPLAAAEEMALEISKHSPQAIRAGKKLYDQTWLKNTAFGFAMEERLQKSLLGSSEQMEAMQALIEKREAKFS